ncbi:BPSS1780 family membrane protein [Chiayiivirga flava]|uniref:Putative membrane protein n=1 Tax=Chiayiivirga flava TaxID=659595 RepID=A0A7W8G2I8_9GAMM|nr:BPSS1780 family membrane protein [Chiayiivirga flava]MBB5208760.1 putative membrane protein [Chiayiivirga flava]
MSFQTVPAGQGLKWLTESVNLVLRNPGPFALMGVVVAVVSLVPLLGSLALAILGPALYGGIMYAAREQDGGGTADFKHLFQAFNEPGKLPKMLMLCLPGIAAGIVIGILAVIFLGGALLGAGITGATNSGGAVVGAGLGAGFLLFFVIALAIGVFAYALTFFATPRVMLDNIEPIPAMQESLKACLANIGAILVYVGILLLVAIVVMVVIGFVSPILAQLLLTIAFVPVVSVAMYRAWRDVFRGSVTQEIAPVDAPPPPAPPSPPPSFEA